MLRKAAVGGGEQAASRDRHAPSGMENAYRGACSLAVSRQANPLHGVRFGANVDGSSRAGGNIHLTSLVHESRGRVDRVRCGYPSGPAWI